jgi:protein-disulfide isomerase
MRIFYIVLAGIAIVGIVLAGVFVLKPPSVAPTGAPGATPIASNGPTGRTADGYYYKGNVEAKVVVTEYADYQCPGCGFFARSSSAAFEQKYVATGKIQFVYHEFPLNIHPNAIPSAEAARCAGDLGAYWQMHDYLFYNQNQWSNLTDASGQFAIYAGQIGIDKTAFSACLANHTHQADVNKALKESEQLQLTGTPSFAVNGKIVDTTGAQSVDDIVARVEAQVDAALAGQ